MVQSLAYPRIVKLLKYRYTCQFGLFLFAMGCIVLPFSNQISGPIPAQEFNSSASGSGMIDDSAPFCGYDVSTNSTAQIGNSITRVPFKVWVIIMMITALQIVGRSVVFKYLCSMFKYMVNIKYILSNWYSNRTLSNMFL